MLADDEEADHRPGGVERRDGGDDVVIVGLVLARGELGESEVVQRLLDDVMNVRNHARVSGEPRGRRWGEDERDLTEDADGQEAEKEVGEASAAPDGPGEEGEDERREKVRGVHDDREHLERAGRSVVEMILEPQRRQRAEAQYSVGIDLRRVMNRKTEIRD